MNKLENSSPRRSKEWSQRITGTDSPYKRGQVGEQVSISGRFMGGVPDTPPVEPPTLASKGIDKNLAKRGS